MTFCILITQNKMQYYTEVDLSLIFQGFRESFNPLSMGRKPMFPPILKKYINHPKSISTTTQKYINHNEKYINHNPKVYQPQRKVYQPYT